MRKAHEDDDLTKMAQDLDELLNSISSVGSSAAESSTPEDPGSRARIFEPPAAIFAEVPPVSSFWVPPEEESRSRTSELALQLGLSQLGLRVAPKEFGEGMFIASAEQIGRVVDQKVQKIQAMLNALKRYTDEIEHELEAKEDQLKTMTDRLEEEHFRRLEAEKERDALQEKRATLEASVVGGNEAVRESEKEVEEMDKQAELIAQKVALGQMTQEEADACEEELIRAQARRLTAQQRTARDEKQLQQVAAASEEATRRLAAADSTERRLRTEMSELQRILADTQAEKEAEIQKREESDSRFNQLVQRIQARASR